MIKNPVKEKLARGEAIFGGSCGVIDEMATRWTVKTGIDFLWIDTEHSPFGVESIRMLPILARQAGCMPMVRVAGLDSSLIKKALDIGAQCIMIPQINNAEEARLAVSYAKYPPMGTRGISPNWTFFFDNLSWEDYLPQANDEIMLVAQIESPEGIENIDAICQVEGIDVVLAGPADLSASLGVIGQMQHPKLKQFLAEFPAKVTRNGKVAGIALGSVDAALEAYAQGYRYISYGSLLGTGVRGLSEDLKKLRAAEAAAKAS
jgi:4-hydroxy-2-oxoheptanedioate aldolase